MDKNKSEYFYCVNHPSKHAKQYCEYQSCKVLICNTCALAKHSSHIPSLRNLHDLYASNTDYLHKILQQYQKTIGDKTNVFQCIVDPFHQGHYYCEKCKGFLCEACTIRHEKGHGLIDKNKLLSQLKQSVDLFMSFITYSDNEAYDGIELMDLNEIKNEISTKVIELIQIKQKIEDIANKRRRLLMTTIKTMHKSLCKKKKPIFPSEEVISNIKALYEKITLENDVSLIFRLYSEFKLTIDSFLGSLPANNQHLKSVSQSIEAMQITMKEHNTALINYIKAQNRCYVNNIGYYCKLVQNSMIQNDESLRRNMTDILKITNQELIESYPSIIFEKDFEKYKSPVDSENELNIKGYSNSGIKLDHMSLMFIHHKEALGNDRGSSNRIIAKDNNRFGDVAICQCIQLAFIQSLALFSAIKINPPIKRSLSKSFQLNTPKLEIQRKDNSFEFSSPPQIEYLNKTGIAGHLTEARLKSPPGNQAKESIDYSQMRTDNLNTNDDDDEEEGYRMIKYTPNNTTPGNINTNMIVNHRNMSELDIHIDNHQNVSKAELEHSFLKAKLDALNQKYEDNSQLKEIEQMISIFSIEERRMIEILFLNPDSNIITAYNPYIKTKEELKPFINNSNKHSFQSFPIDYSFVNIQPYAYLSGGKKGKKEVDTLFRLKRINNNQYTFIKLCPLKESRSCHGSIFIQKYNSIFFLSGAKTKSCEKYNIELNAMEPLTALNSQRERCASCVVNDLFLFVFFGFDRSQGKFVSTIEKLELKKKTNWKLITLPGNQSILKRYGSSCFRYDYDGRKGIIIVGGSNAKGETNDALFFNIDINTAYLYTSFSEVNCSFLDCDFYSIGKNKINIANNCNVISFNGSEGIFL